MPDNFTVRTWAKSLPSRGHPERNEDAYFSARNGMAHAVIDGMGSSRRVVNGREVGGEHAAAGLVAALNNRLQDLPSTIAAPAARELLTIAAAEAGEDIFKEINASGNIPPEQVPEGRTANDVMAAACMTALIFCEAGRRAVIGQNGDTRAYLYSGGELILLTDDQDAIYLDLANGVITEEQAVALDSGFVAAWAALSAANSYLYSNATPSPAVADRARSAADRALALDPQNPVGYGALGNYHRLVTGNDARAVEQFTKGLALAPNDVELLRFLGTSEQALGPWIPGPRRWRMRSASPCGGSGGTTRRLRPVTPRWRFSPPA